jgi:UDP-glucosyltransferase BX8/BX9
VPDLKPLQARDLIRVDGSDTDALCGFVGHVADAVRASASGVVIYTFERMEASELAKIQRELSRPALARAVPSGVRGGASALAVPGTDGAEPARARPRLLAWLDDHPPRSVLYVSLGSVACVDRGAFVEMAWGLARSRVSFLWVGRPGLVGGVARAGPTQTGRAGGRSSSRACCGGLGPNAGRAGDRSSSRADGGGVGPNVARAGGARAGPAAAVRG